MSQDSAASTSVVIVGGGLVGLSAAIFLASKDVPVIVVERHAKSSIHPRAIGYTQRTMELYRTVGLEERIPQHASRGKPRRVRAESLAGKWHEETYWTDSKKPGELLKGQQPAKEANPVPKPQPPRMDYSPCNPAAIPQDHLEPILRDRARELGVDIRLETTLVKFEQDDHGVTVTVRDRDSKEISIKAAYLIAADGHRSSVREALGIARTGAGHLRTVRSILFRAPLDEYLKAGISQFNIEQPEFEAFLTTYRDGRWVLMLTDEERFDEVMIPQLVHRALGLEDIKVEIITTGRWQMSALIASTFSVGRVFLAGDAAHMLPPNRGGYGANTGIEDAHNLAWKLAAVLNGSSHPRLLETYDTERRPIAWLRHDQIFARGDFKAPDSRNNKTFSAGVKREVPIIEDNAMELGQLYRSSAVVGASSSLPPALKPDEWAGQPGTRAPHLWLSRTSKGGTHERLSTLDLFGGTEWVVLGEEVHWQRITDRVRKLTKVPIVFICICASDIKAGSNTGRDVWPEEGIKAWQQAFGVNHDDGVLVRPDGYIAWKATEMQENESREAGLLKVITDIAV